MQEESKQAAEGKLRAAGRAAAERGASAEALQAELRAALAARDNALKVMPASTQLMSQRCSMLLTTMHIDGPAEVV